VTRGGVVPKIFIENSNWNAARILHLCGPNRIQFPKIFLNQIF
jgi:hypothetical protein